MTTVSYRVTTPHASRRREFADEDAALAYARGLFRADARLASVDVVRVEEHARTYRRDEMLPPPRFPGAGDASAEVSA